MQTKYGRRHESGKKMRYNLEKRGRKQMIRRRMMHMFLALCVLIAAGANAECLQFAEECPPMIRQMLDDHGFSDARVVCGAMIGGEESCAFLVAQGGTGREVIGLRWTENTGKAAVDSFGSCGLELAGAPSVTTLIEGEHPVGRRFVLGLENGDRYEFVSAFAGGWNLYRYTNADGFCCTLNSGRMYTEQSDCFVPCSAWLGNWPDLGLFPKNEKEVAAFALSRWEGIHGRSLVWGAHLREKPTSSSRSLGRLHVVLAEVLEQKPGKTHPWYRVRIGQTEGWVSGPYVVDAGESRNFAFNASLGTPWAVTRAECMLYSAADGGEASGMLPAGTFMQVLAEAENGRALVLVTDEPQNFRLDAPGRSGYVRMEDVEIHQPGR